MPDQYSSLPLPEEPTSLPEWLPEQRAWINFTISLRKPFTEIDDVDLLPFHTLRNSIILFVENPTFLQQFRQGWSEAFAPNPQYPQARMNLLGDLFYQELEAFTNSVKAQQESESPSNELPPEERKSFWRKILGRGSTVVGSAKDLIDNNPELKMGFTLLKELLDIFKG